MRSKINVLLGKAWFPVTFRIITFFAFWILIFFGLKARSEYPVLDSQLYRTNLTNVFVWDIWWPVILLCALIFGRVWCMVCPVEMVTSFFSKMGIKKNRPGWIDSGWVITVFYAVVVIAGVTILEIDFNPRYTAYYLLVIFAIAVMTGFIFEKNTFCRSVCPVGYLLAVFSRMAAWGWRVRDKKVCRACTDKSCINPEYLYNLNYKSCGVDLYPSEINDNNNCILCTGCLKTCATYKSNSSQLRPNPAFTRTGFASGMLDLKPFRIVEWFFLYFLTAHLIDEITEFQFITTVRDSLFQQRFSALLNPVDGITGKIVASVFLFFVLPLFLWWLPYIAIKIFRLKISVSDYLKNFTVVYIPVILSLFAGLIVWEIVVRIPYYKYIFADPVGIDTIRGILTKQIVLNKMPGWADTAFLVLLLCLLAGGITLSIRMISKYKSRYMVPNGYGLYTSLFVYVVIFSISVLLYHNF